MRLKGHMVAAVLAMAVLIFWLGAFAAMAMTHRYDATVKCGSTLTEDTAAHVKLVRYEAGGSVLIYRCQSNF